MRQIKPRLNSLAIALLLSFVLGAFVACEEDYNLTNAELVGDESLISDPDSNFKISAYSKQINGTRTNIAALNKSGMMGIYKDPVFGETKVDYLTQMKMRRAPQDFGENAVVDSVKLYLPFYSKIRFQDGGQDTVYELDSIYSTGVLRVEVYESKYYLMEMDPTTNFENSQAYYSNQGDVFDNHIGEQLGVIPNFYPEIAPYKNVRGEGDDKEVEILSPGLYMNLSTDFFQDKIIAYGGKPELVSDDAFANHFRGLYFKVSPHPTVDETAYFLFDNTDAFVKMYYSYDAEQKDDEGEVEVVRREGLLEFDFSDTAKLALFDKDIAPSVQQHLDNPEDQTRLYTQGGESILSIIELFGEDSDENGVADELELLRLDKPIVNEANLVFYVDQNTLGDDYQEPERIIIFNAENGKVLTDYVLDGTATANKLGSKINHLGRLERAEDGKGISYKLRITNYISDLINNEKDNIPLAIAVVPNVDMVDAVEVIESEENGVVGAVVSGSLFSPKGTVFHGPESEDESKRLRLELYLTDVE